ncbi:MAG: hypothetical protein AB9891_12655 [Anaerolineaceae bacterium]
MGRFVSRDRWGGRQDSPITYNRWLYGNGNPVIFIDPSGQFSSSPIHAMIQAHFAETYGAGHLVIPEFYVSGGSKQGLGFSLDVEGNIINSGTPNGNAGFIDIVDMTTGEAYEIKKEKELIMGQGQISFYISIYNENPRPGGPRQLIPGTNYRTAASGWEVIGTNPIYPGQVILAHLKSPGVITYYGQRKDRISIPVPEYFWEWDFENKIVEKRRSNTIPNLSPSPVTSINDLASVCSTVLLVGITVGLLATPIPDDILLGVIWGKILTQ